MSGKRRSRRQRLQHAQAEQRKLEDEVKQLEAAADPAEACKEIITFVNTNADKDPLLDFENNEFRRQANCFIKGTKILISSQFESQNYNNNHQNINCQNSGSNYLNNTNNTIQNNNYENCMEILKSPNKFEYKNIEDIKIGDKVVCVVFNNNNYNFQTNKLKLNINKSQQTGNVYHTTHNIEYQTCKIKLNNNNIIECTLQHPFFVANKGWKTVGGGENMSKEERISHGYNLDPTMNKIGKLEIGDELISFDGKYYEIEEMIFNEYNNGIDVYNISVDNGKTFFADGVLVHNKTPCVIL